MKHRANIYLSDLNYARLEAAAHRPGMTKSGIVDDALEAYFKGSSDDAFEAVIARRLDRLTNQFSELEKKDTVNGETLALFIRYFLMVTPQLPADQIDAARAKSEDLFQQFLEQLGRDLQGGKRVLQRAVDYVFADEAAFFTEADLDRLNNPAPKRAQKSPMTEEAGHA